MDGTLGRSAQSVHDVSNNLDKKLDIDVCLWDERLSTVGAFNLSSQLDINVTTVSYTHLTLPTILLV